MPDTIDLEILEQQKHLLDEIAALRQVLRLMREDTTQHRRETSGLYTQFNLASGRFDLIEEHFNATDRRLDVLTGGQTALSTKIDAVRADIDTIAQRIATGLAEIKQQITELRTTLR